ncbi:hypothetical protein [Streptomyces sp. NPDC006334]|uniref:hypothetical protein n=1 Tax=Streptomyces sp. NPDC006334 TaxID=3156754 RepID=UPI0033B5EBA4
MVSEDLLRKTPRSLFPGVVDPAITGGKAGGLMGGQGKGAGGRPGWRDVRDEDGQQRRWRGEDGTAVHDDVAAWVNHLRDLLAAFATDKEAADALKWPTSKVSRYVNGHEVPTADFVTRLLRAKRPDGSAVTKDVRSVTRARHLAALEIISPTRAAKYRTAYERDELIDKVRQLEEQERSLQEEITSKGREAEESERRLRAQYSAEKEQLAGELARARDQVRELEQRLADAKARAKEAVEADRRELVRFRSQAESRLEEAQQWIRHLEGEATERERVRRAETERLSAAQEHIAGLKKDLARTQRALAEAEERADSLLERLLESRAEVTRIRSAMNPQAAADHAVAEALRVIDNAYQQQQGELVAAPTTTPTAEEGPAEGPRLARSPAQAPTRTEGSTPPETGQPRRKRSAWNSHRTPPALAHTARAVALLLGLAAVWLGFVQVANLRHDALGYLTASPCAAASPANGQADCVSHETGDVAEKKPADGSNENRLSITRASGKTEADLQVGRDLYNAAHLGSPVDLAIWKSHIVRVSVAGESSRISNSPQSAVWMAGLVVLGMVTAACGVLGRKTPWPWFALALVPILFIWTAFAAEVMFDCTDGWSAAACFAVWSLAPAALAVYVKRARYAQVRR